jgi:hypothetical protein
VGRISTLIEARQTLAPRPPDLDCLGLPTLDPRLCLVYQPHRSETVPPPDPVRLLLESIRRVWPATAEGATGVGGRRPIGAWGLGLQPVAGPWALLQPVAADPGPGPVAGGGGLHLQGPGPQGLHLQGLGPQGLHLQGPGPQGLHLQGLGPQGLHLQGPGPQGLHLQGPGPQGLHLQGPGPQGLHLQGLGPQGLHLQGLGPQGLHLQGPGPQGLHLQGLGPQGLHLQGPGPQGLHLQGPGPQGLHLQGPGSWGWGLGPAPAGPVVGGEAKPDPLGLSEARNPQKQPRRYGLRGLTPAGARQIQRATAILQDELGKLSFWTVTLPDSTIRELVSRDLWPQFQTRVRDLLVRALKKRGMTPRVVGVVELHPSRSMRERLPLPHMHVVFHGSRYRWQRWVLSTADLDRIIRDAVRYVGLPAPNVSQAGKVEAVRANAGAYLAKYMVKNGEAAWLEQVPGNLPRVWWFWSAPLRVQVLELVLPVCWSFVSWLHRLPPEALELIGAVRVRLELPDPRAPSTWCVRWRRNDDLRRAADLWRDRDRWLQSQGLKLI